MGAGDTSLGQRDLVDAAMGLAPILSERGQGKARFGRDFRFKLIVEAALSSLAGPAERGDPQARAKAFELAAATVGQSSGRIIAASASRASVGVPELEELIRQRQDLEQNARVLREGIERAMTVNPGAIAGPFMQRMTESVVRLQNETGRLDEEIATRFPRYDGMTASRPMSLAQLQSELPNGASLILAYVGRNDTYVWAVSASANEFNRVGKGAEEIGDTVAVIRSALDVEVSTLGDLPAFDVASSHALYKEVLHPLESVWRPTPDLIFVTSGALTALPPAMLALSGEQPQADGTLLFAEYRKVDWLIDDHAVTVAPSVASYVALLRSERRQPTKTYLAFADPVFSSAPPRATSGTNRGIHFNFRAVPKTRSLEIATLRHLPPLPDTRLEVEAIAKSLNADPASLFLGERASEQSLRTLDQSGDLTNYRILSFATHGLKPGDLNGLTQPALVLSLPDSQQRDYDGLLAVDEILSFRLGADWVVLSACNTAASDDATADAFSGLARAFFYAGAKSVLVSHWPVHSLATRDLMIGLFSKYTSDGGSDRARALQVSSKAMIRSSGPTNEAGETLFSYAHPIFWAPFTLVGDGGGRRPNS